MSDYLFDTNETINNGDYVEFKPKFFKPITKDNIYLLEIYGVNNNNKLKVQIYNKLDNETRNVIEIIIIYKNKYHLYLSYSYNKQDVKNGLINIGSIPIFNQEQSTINTTLNVPISRKQLFMDKILRNILDEINNLSTDISMTYLNLLSKLIYIPFIQEIYVNYENVFDLLPEQIRNTDIFSIIANYI